MNGELAPEIDERFVKVGLAEPAFNERFATPEPGKTIKSFEFAGFNAIPLTVPVDTIVTVVAVGGVLYEVARQQ